MTVMMWIFTLTINLSGPSAPALQPFQTGGYATQGDCNVARNTLMANLSAAGLSAGYSVSICYKAEVTGRQG